ncbi:MAG: formylglycine-generating enzyme family protein [bacterium]|nr:formylglycine-generating enzyme family protein [bacterium]
MRRSLSLCAAGAVLVLLSVSAAPPVRPVDLEPAEGGQPACPPGMVHVPGGPFIMGSNVGDRDESPRHLAQTGTYFIDIYEVGNADFKRFDPDFAYPEGQDNHAAIVTWERAAAYAKWARKRLPTEAEWEKAARGEDGRTFPWGERWDTSFIAWDEGDPRAGSIARPRSPYGCVDMAGGAWEYTADWYKPYEGNDTPCDAYGETYKVIRGGASFNDCAMVRTTHRYYVPPNSTGYLRTGFRCVKDAGPGG